MLAAWPLNQPMLVPFWKLKAWQTLPFELILLHKLARKSGMEEPCMRVLMLLRLSVYIDRIAGFETLGALEDPEAYCSALGSP